MEDILMETVELSTELMIAEQDISDDTVVISSGDSHADGHTYGLDIAERVTAYDALRTDIMYMRKDITFLNIDDSIIINLPDIVLMSTLHPTRYAIRQVCHILGMPAQYILKCPPEYTVQHFKYWNREVSKSRKVRLCLHGRDRLIGVLGERYKPYFHKAFMTDISETLTGNKIEYRTWSLSDECFDWNILLPNSSVNDNFSDGKLVLGLHARNSEVGFASAQVTAIVYNTEYHYNISLDNFMIRNKCRSVHVARDHDAMSDKFTSSLVEFLLYLDEEYDNFMRIVLACGNYTLKIRDIRAIIDENRLPKEIIDEYLESALFSDDTDPDKEYNFRDLIDYIARASVKKPYPARWTVEKIVGNIISKFQSTQV